MAQEILSQAELDALLHGTDASSAMPVGPGPIAPHAPRTGEAPPSPKPETATARDFNQSQRVRKNHILALGRLHDAVGRGFGAALSSLLRAPVDVKLLSVDERTYGDFQRVLENPTCLNVLRATPLQQWLLVDFNPSILYPIIDRLLGGGREPASVARRPLTQIERRLASRVMDLFLRELHNASPRGHDAAWTVERMESDPRCAALSSDGESVVVTSLELSIADSRGRLALCIPTAALQSMIEPRSSSGRGASGSPWGKNCSRARTSTRGLVELVATLAETTIGTGDLLNLHVGDIITTEKDIHSPLDVSVAGVTKFRARPGALRGHKAIQIESAETATANPSANRRRTGRQLSPGGIDADFA